MIINVCSKSTSSLKEGREGDILADFYRVVLQMLSPTKGTQDRESSQLLHPFDLAFNKKRSKAESLFRLH